MTDNTQMPLPEEQTSQEVAMAPNSEPQAACSCESVCAETESPALDLAEAADAISHEEAAEETRVNYSSMSKAELLEVVKTFNAEQNVTSHREVSLIRAHFANLRKAEQEAELLAFVEAGNAPETFSSALDPVEQEFKEEVATFRARRTEWLEKEESRRQENLAKKIAAIDAIKALMEDVDNINRNYQAFQDLQTEFKAVKDVPQEAETEVWKQFQIVVEQFYDLLKLNRELRDLDFKKNLDEKRLIIEEARKLTEMEDCVAAIRKLHDLHNHWREVGPVDKELREQVWAEFKELSTVVNKRHQDFFMARKDEETANAAAKEKLCEEAEAITYADFTTRQQWEEATAKFLELQTRWKEIGFAGKKQNVSVFARFRKAFDDYFTAKAAYFDARKAEQKAATARKVALCERAEAIAAGDINREAAEAIRALREEWKTAGSADRHNSETLWNRFSKACNSVFDTLRANANERRSTEKANLEAKKAIVAKLHEMIEQKSGTAEEFQALQAEWRGIGFVPMSAKEALQEEYRECCRQLSATLGVRKGRDGREGRDQRPAGRRGGERREQRREIKADSPIGQLQDRLRARKADLATYENNLGFFKIASKSGNNMVKEMERKIENIKAEIAELEKHIAAQANA